MVKKVVTSLGLRPRSTEDLGFMGSEGIRM